MFNAALNYAFAPTQAFPEFFFTSALNFILLKPLAALSCHISIIERKDSSESGIIPVKISIIIIDLIHI